MKRFAILSVILAFGLGAYAIDVPPSVGGLVNDVGYMQNTDSQLRLLQEDRFRKEEYNEFQDMKQVKEARNKRVKLEQEYQNVQRQQQGAINTYNQDLMLKRID